MAAAVERDRFGLGWRRELASQIQSSLERLDVLEVVADDWFDASRARIDALRWLARSVPVSLHGVSLGLASTEPVDERRLGRLARLVERSRCATWSEHFAFVRGDGVEIGHLAAPARVNATVEGTARNVERAIAVVGSVPALENVATLLEPPLSRFDEAEWLTRSLRASGCDLLLDLHNLHTNATNLGFDTRAFLDRIPLGRVTTVHIAGGRWVGHETSRRWLDDHQHDVPDPVFDLLEELCVRAPQPLTVILERDGRFPALEDLLAELDRARRAVARGRARSHGALEAVP